MHYRSNCNTNNEVDFSSTFSVPEEYYKGLKSNRKPIVGDVLYTVTASYGIPVIVKEEKDFCFQRHIGLIRPSNTVDSNWLYYLMMSPQVFKQADSGATGTAQKTVSLKVLRGILVPNIPLNSQKEMVDGLNFIYKQSKCLENIYSKKLLALDELKKSILQKAFTGELTKSKGIAA
jgi:type I restriction enzyme S subunit